MKESLQEIRDFLNSGEWKDAVRAVYRGKGTPSQKKLVFGIPVFAVGLLLIIFLLIPTFWDILSDKRERNTSLLYRSSRYERQ